MQFTSCAFFSEILPAFLAGMVSGLSEGGDTSTNISGYQYENVSYNTSFADEVEWLAVEIACIGKYDMTYTDTPWHSDPKDYYTTDLVKDYLKSKANKKTRTVTFEGICFDYAEFGFREIQSYQSYYNKKGMNGSHYYIVGTDKNPNVIEIYVLDPYSTTRINGFPARIIQKMNIKAHGNATMHAWLWIYHQDGSIYWLDPTWTDNRGQPVFGIVKNGREIEIKPNPNLCVR